MSFQPRTHFNCFCVYNTNNNSNNTLEEIYEHVAFHEKECIRKLQRVKHMVIIIYAFRRPLIPFHWDFLSSVTQIS